MEQNKKKIVEVQCENVRFPNICTCCLSSCDPQNEFLPYEDNILLEDGKFKHISFAKVPTCRACQSHMKKSRRKDLIIGIFITIFIAGGYGWCRAVAGSPQALLLNLGFFIFFCIGLAFLFIYFQKTSPNREKHIFATSGKPFYSIKHKSEGNKTFLVFEFDTDREIEAKYAHAFETVNLGEISKSGAG